MNRIFAGPALLVLLAASGTAARAAQYTAIDLYAMQLPVGLTQAFPTSAFAGQVVGLASNPDDESAPPPRAVLWNQNGSPVDLTLNGFDDTGVVGTDGTYQFGWARTGTPGYGPTFTPVVWSGSAASATILNKGGFTSATVAGSGGGQFVGGALLWNGLAAQPINLSPADLKGTNGTQQVGSRYAFDTNHNAYYHAMLWTGSANSAVELHPTSLPGIVSSEALATDGGQQVGWGGPYLVYSAYGHALVWSGTANSAVDLNPAGFGASVAYGVRNGKQVGLAQAPDYQDHAMLWNGTAASAVDLNLLLPNSFAYSRAYSIDDAGHVFGVAFNGSEQQYHAIEWLPVVQPSGDYNNDGKVDAADYLVWRKNQGTTKILPNDPTGGTVGTIQYNTWRAHFGQIAGSGSGANANAAVPEPSTMVFVMLGFASLTSCFRRNHTRRGAACRQNSAAETSYALPVTLVTLA